jgi:hypothetical protein
VGRPPNRLEVLAGLPGIDVEHGLRCAGLQRDDRHRVSDDVVELTRQTRPLRRHRLPGELGPSSLGGGELSGTAADEPTA